MSSPLLVLTPNRVAERLRALLEREPGVCFAYLYGSHAFGYARPESDVDVAAFFAEEADRGPELGLQARLTRELGARVEVINLNERPAAEFFRRVLPTALVLKDAPERIGWEREQGAMATKEPGTPEDYLAFVLDSMHEKNAALQQALPFLDEIDLDRVRQGELKEIRGFLGAFLLVFQPWKRWRGAWQTIFI